MYPQGTLILWIYAGDFGLMDYRSRWYASSLGRFTQPDTIIPDLSSPQALNRYSYVLNNPINLVDPSGHRYCDWDADSGGCSSREFEEDYDWDPRTWSYGGGGNGTDPYCDKEDVDCSLQRKRFVGGTVTNAVAMTVGETIDDGLTFFTGCGIACQFGYEDPVGWGWRLVSGASLAIPFLGGRALRYLGEIGSSVRLIDKFKNLPTIPGFDRHHIIEQRFARALGLDPKEMLSISLPKDVHQQITNKWRDLIGYSRNKKDIITTNASPDNIWEAAQFVYEGVPELLDAAYQTMLPFLGD